MSYKPDSRSGCKWSSTNLHLQIKRPLSMQNHLAVQQPRSSQGKSLLQARWAAARLGVRLDPVLYHAENLTLQATEGLHTVTASLSSRTGNQKPSLGPAAHLADAWVLGSKRCIQQNRLCWLRQRAKERSGCKPTSRSIPHCCLPPLPFQGGLPSPYSVSG